MAKPGEHSVGNTTSEMLEDGFDDLSFFAEDAAPPALNQELQCPVQVQDHATQGPMQKPIRRYLDAYG